MSNYSEISEYNKKKLHGRVNCLFFKSNIFFCQIKRYSNIYFSATMNLYLQIYLYICDKLPLHFTDLLIGTIAL